MKPFDFEKARAGAKICTRDGRDVRIVCWDMKNSYPIIGLITHKDGREYYQVYNNEGRTPSLGGENAPCDSDLMMAPEKHEGWINIYHSDDGSRYFTGGVVYDTEIAAAKGVIGKIATIKIEWEE